MADSPPSHEIQTVPETNDRPKQKDIITFMDAEWYNAAADGKIDKFDNYTEPLDLLRTPNKNTVLHVYITAVGNEPKESIEFVELVISKCPSLLVEPNIKGETPLHIAARFGHKNIVEILIHSIKKAPPEDPEKGVEASTSDKMLKKTKPDEDTALHEAVRYNHPRVVETLIGEYPEFANITNAAGESPLYLATVRQYSSIAFMILKKCTSSAAYAGPKGSTALHEAVISKDQDLTRKILEQNSSLTKEQDQQGYTPLHYASRFNLLPIVETLLEFDKSTAYIGEKDGKTPLHLAIFRGGSHLKVVEKIMSDCPDCCDLTDKSGRNALHFAVKSKSSRGVKTISEKPSLANLINQKDIGGNTPVHLLAAFGSPGLSVLQHHLVDKMAVNNENLTALDMVGKEMELSNVIIFRLRTLGIMSRLDSVPLSDLRKASESYNIVATLMATVTFAAGFNLPGDFSDHDGPDERTAILSRKAAFKIFLITDALAFSISIAVVFINSSLTFFRPKGENYTIVFAVTFYTVFAMVLMAVAFMTGVYAVIPHSSSGLGAAICVIIS
ncbi:hypothetical protein GH714_030044 [Hevea brasiliensis]|uniref:PGG domain-containing protein n=1 Tax=Hevea brasiliensis TaxID=3981 RepID=A0A6A6N4V7_HEVBR|nr:hypothetical protein GH714_030044 [Hevea brasiliensis]